MEETKMVNLKINGIAVSVPEGSTILDAARKAGIEIPTLCYMKEKNEIGACRICVVEATGAEAALKTAIEAVRTDGRVSLAGFFDHPLKEFSIDEPILKGVSLCGAAGRFGNAVKVSKLMEKSPLKLTPVITHRVKFADCLEFFENEQKYHKDKIKVMMEF